ncbi:unnamed protein product [Allacma fusca]|uniref:F-box domain-containing protein n=1 Tax=Allacma fusca TaxID=39272 RepID=A0A8J2NTV6_9HEXA|nr:unnamed protein product [Allacma fusca]
MDPEEYAYVGHLSYQVFSNHLLVNTIWRHFSMETLRTLSLVCRSFCVISRKRLRDHHFLPLGISISFDGPCKRLEAAEEIIRDSTDSPYNSIALFKPRKCHSFEFGCSNNCREGKVEDMCPSILQCHQIDETYFKHLKPFTTIRRSLNPNGLLEIQIAFSNKNFKL